MNGRVCVCVWLCMCVCVCGGLLLRDHLSAEINTGRAQQRGLGFMGGAGLTVLTFRKSTVNKVSQNK